MQIRSPRTILALSATLALTAAALAPTAALAKGPGPGAGSCDGECTADQPQVQKQIQARNGSGQQTGTKANAGGGQQVQARAGNGGGQVRQAGTAEGRGRNAKQAVDQGWSGNGQNARQGAGEGPNEDGQRGPGTCEDCDAEMGTLTQEQIDGLVFMAYEEKLAHDVYTKLAELHGVRVFGNISGSEARHLAAVRTVLERYGIDDPTADLPAGDFMGNPVISSLYDQLIGQGSASLEDAIGVGVLIEEMDIDDLKVRMADLEAAAPEDFAADVHEMYSHLLTASEHHLEAFQGWL